MEKTQTAVEWLIDELTKTQFLWLSDKPEMNDLIEIIKQAKEMEKEQIIDAYNIGSYDTSEKQFRPEQYYNETYGSK